MGTERPANEDLSQQVSAPFSISEFETLYEGYMDSMLTLTGRVITVWLQPAQSPSTTNPDRYDPWSGTKDPRLNTPSEGDSGRAVTPIYVQYRAQIVHGPRAISDNMPFELDENDVQITTVIGAEQDLDNAVEIEVDGLKFDSQKVKPRRIGLQTPKYLISVWTRKAD